MEEAFEVVYDDETKTWSTRPCGPRMAREKRSPRFPFCVCTILTLQAIVALWMLGLWRSAQYL
jgi:hypothetical protein